MDLSKAGTTKKARGATHLRRPAIACALVALVFALMALSLTGCRFSDELTEHLYDPLNGQLNAQMEPEYKQVDNAQEDPTRVSAILRESVNVTEQTPTQPTYDPAGVTEIQTAQHVYDATSANDAKASLGSLFGLDPNRSSDASSKQEEQPQEEQGEESTEQNEQASNETSENPAITSESTTPSTKTAAGNGPTGGNEATGGNGGTGTVYADGTYQDLPENVQAVATSQSLARIVQMLAGANALVAADETFLSDTLASSAFTLKTDGSTDETREGLVDVTAAWSGDGTAEGSLDLDKLLEAFDPWLSKGQKCAILTDGSRPALSQDETDTLTAAGVDIVIMPTLGAINTPDDNIVTAVQVIGELLRNSASEYDAAQMADLYVRQHNDVLDECVRTNKGYTCKTSAQYIYQGSDGGTPTTNISSNRLTLAYVDSWISVDETVTAIRSYYGGNSAAELPLNGQELHVSGIGLSTSFSSGFALMDYYLQTSGFVNNAYDSVRPLEGKPYAVVPGTLLTRDVPTDITQRIHPSGLWYAPTGSGDFVTVGDATFPAVLAANDGIASAIAESASESNGLYNVGSGYPVYVVPSGFAGSWAEGTVESYLLAAWTLSTFRTGDHDMTFANNCTSNLYSAFYRTPYSSVDEVVTDYQNMHWAG